MSESTENRVTPAWREWLDRELERLQGELARRLPLSGDEAGRVLMDEAVRRTHGVRSGVAALSPREREVVDYACRGHYNKLIAYELGLSDSTVRVLLWRAMRKLGASSRAELLKLARPAEAAVEAR